MKTEVQRKIIEQLDEAERALERGDEIVVTTTVSVFSSGAASFNTSIREEDLAMLGDVLQSALHWVSVLAAKGDIDALINVGEVPPSDDNDEDWTPVAVVGEA